MRGNLLAKLPEFWLMFKDQGCTCGLSASNPQAYVVGQGVVAWDRPPLLPWCNWQSPQVVMPYGSLLITRCAAQVGLLGFQR